MSRNKGVTLIELIAATMIFAIIVSAAGLGINFINRMDTNKQAYAPALAGAQILEYLFVRLLRSNQVWVKDSGRTLEFELVEETGTTRQAKFMLDAPAKTLLYDYDVNDDNSPEIVAKGIEDIVFSTVSPASRVSIELEVTAEDVFQTVLQRLTPFMEKEAFAVELQPSTLKLRTSVRGRNMPTPRGLIN